MTPMTPASLYCSRYGCMAAVTSGLAGGSFLAAGADRANTTKPGAAIASLLCMPRPSLCDRFTVGPTGPAAVPSTPRVFAASGRPSSAKDLRQHAGRAAVGQPLGLPAVVVDQPLV